MIPTRLPREVLNNGKQSHYIRLANVCKKGFRYKPHMPNHHPSINPDRLGMSTDVYQIIVHILNKGSRKIYSLGNFEPFRQLHVSLESDSRRSPKRDLYNWSTCNIVAIFFNFDAVQVLEEWNSTLKPPWIEDLFDQISTL